MAKIIDFAHACAARERGDFFFGDVGDGRGTFLGQGTSGQLSENHCKPRSRRRTVMLQAPSKSNGRTLPSSNAYVETVDMVKPLASPKARATDNKQATPVISDKSVIFPGKSREKLPDVAQTKSGNLPLMNWAAIYRFIQGRLDELNLSADKASRLAGKPDAIRNIRRNVEKGSGGVTATTLAALETALKMPAGTLQRIGSEPSTPITGGELQQLRAELKVLLDQAAALNKKIEGLQYAISILEDGKPSKSRTRPATKPPYRKSG